VCERELVGMCMSETVGKLSVCVRACVCVCEWISRYVHA
jgi:hypothetical protein